MCNKYIGKNKGSSEYLRKTQENEVGVEVLKFKQNFFLSAFLPLFLAFFCHLTKSGANSCLLISLGT